MITAKGRLRHRFWGEYSAVIALAFTTGDECALATKILNEAHRPEEGWAISPTDNRAAVMVVDSDGLEKAKKQLAGFGADPDAIDSLAHSVDFGDPFKIVIRTATA